MVYVMKVEGTRSASLSSILPEVFQQILVTNTL